MKKYLLLCLLLATVIVSNAQWNAMGTGINGRIRTLVVYNNEVYAGGKFLTNGSGDSIKHVAKWNPATARWIAVGSGLGNLATDSVNSLYVEPTTNTLYAGGTFTTDGSGNALHYIAKWNSSTSTWQDLGTDYLTSFVRGVNSYQGEVYAVGGFQNSGTNHVYRVAKFNAGWNQVGDGLNLSGIVDAIYFDGTDTYISGSINGLFAKLKTDNTWLLLGGTGTVLTGIEALTITKFGGYIYVGGKVAYGMQKYDGTTFTSIFNPLEPADYVYSAISAAGLLVAGGNFTQTSSGTQLNRLFTYNGSSPFAAIGIGFNSDVYAIANWNNKLVVGGAFSTAGSTSANALAITTNVVGIDELNSLVTSQNLFPNPLTDKSILHIETKENLKNPSLQIYDEQSRLVQNVHTEMIQNGNTTDFTISKDGLKSGIYYYFVTSEEKGVISDRFIVE